MFYIYSIDNDYLLINGTMLLRTKKLEKASHWRVKRKALSWEKKILEKYPNAELKEAVLTIK